MCEGVDVAVRSGGAKRVLILTYSAEKALDVRTPAPMRDGLGGGAIDHVTLPRFGVAVLETPAQ